MLRHITGDRFEADVLEEIEVVAEAQNNGGINDARFEYAGRVLPRQTIQGRPGCTFQVQSGRKQLQATVMFADDASASARYDLFEVEEVGGLSDLGQSVKITDSSPLVGFAVEGVAPAAVAGITRGVAAATAAAEEPPKAGRRTAPQTKPARRRKKQTRARPKRSKAASHARKRGGRKHR